MKSGRLKIRRGKGASADLGTSEERGLVAAMGPGGLIYGNAVGMCGVVSAGMRWGRLSSAARRWPLALVGNKEIYALLFPGDTLVLAENEMFGGDYLIVTFLLMIRGYPFSEKKFWYGRFSLVRIPNRCICGKLRYLRIITSLRHWQITHLTKS